MNPTLTFVLAIWGAVISTVAISWQIFIWLRSNPRIVPRVFVIESPTGDETQDYVSFEIRNRGGKPTTIEEIMFISSDGWLSHLQGLKKTEYLSAYKTDDLKLPVVLPPGEIWKGTCYLGPRQDPHRLDRTRRERFLAGRLFYYIRCAHTDRFIRGKVRAED